MAAAWVQAICMTRAHSTSPFGCAPSINAKLAFPTGSEIPLPGSLDLASGKNHRCLHWSLHLLVMAQTAWELTARELLAMLPSR
jgi:hypothetical protein